MTDKEKLAKVRAEIERRYDKITALPIGKDEHWEAIMGAKATTLCLLLSFIDSMQEEPISDDLEKAAEEWDESLYRKDAFKAGARWLNNIICSEIEKRLQYMQYAPHRADTYKELKSLLAYIKSYV